MSQLLTIPRRLMASGYVRRNAANMLSLESNAGFVMAVLLVAPCSLFVLYNLYHIFNILRAPF